MRFHRLDLNLLVALDALLSEQSVSRAGEKLNLSQSATSGALIRLREFFEDELLVQVGRKMVPTPLGESLAKPVRNILIQVRTAIEARPVFDAANSHRRFSFFVSDYVASVFMPEVARRVHDVAPGITFELSELGDTGLEALDRGEIDFLVLPKEWSTDRHPSEELFKDSFVCVAWVENATVRDSMNDDEYSRFGHVIVRWGTERLPTFDEWYLNRQGLQRRIEVVANSFNNIPHFLIGSRRIATVHHRLAEIWLRYLPLKTVPAPQGVPVITEVLQWNKYQELDPGGAWIRRIMHEVAQEMNGLTGV